MVNEINKLIRGVTVQFHHFGPGMLTSLLKALRIPFDALNQLLELVLQFLAID